MAGMKLHRNPTFVKFGGLVGTMAIRAWMARSTTGSPTTTRRSTRCFPNAPGRRSTFSGTNTSCFRWSARALQSGDALEPAPRRGNPFDRVAYHLGFDFVRGSTQPRRRGRVARTARKEPADASDDHARRPARPAPRAGARAVYLASKLRLPLVVMGFGYDRPWRANSWDRFAIPRPFSRARAVISPAIHVPADLDRDGLEHYRVQVERLLNRLTGEAEAWAESGQCKIGEQPVRSEHPKPGALRGDSKQPTPKLHLAA